MLARHLLPLSLAALPVFRPGPEPGTRARSNRQRGDLRGYHPALQQLRLPWVIDELIIEEGATLRVFGSEPFQIFASQRVVIDGVLDGSGIDAPDVNQLQAPQLPKQGGAATLGSGQGGSGSPETTGASAIGNPGWGPFGIASRGGGRGGETSVLQTNNALAREGAGGGGGRLALDEPGGPGSASSRPPGRMEAPVP